MKTVITILFLGFAVSLTGFASDGVSVANSQTQKLEIAKAPVSVTSGANKSKKSHHKAHKKTSGKKTKK